MAEESQQSGGQGKRALAKVERVLLGVKGARHWLVSLGLVVALITMLDREGETATADLIRAGGAYALPAAAFGAVFVLRGAVQDAIRDVGRRAERVRIKIPGGHEVTLELAKVRGYASLADESTRAVTLANLAARSLLEARTASAVREVLQRLAIDAQETERVRPGDQAG